MIKIALIGFGVVGQGFVEILQQKGDQLREQDGLDVQVVAVTTRSRGTLFDPAGLDLNALLAIGSGPFDTYPTAADALRDWNALTMIEHSGADVIVELAYSNLDTGLPAIDHVQAAFKAKQHVILANKGPVALALPELTAAAQAAGCQFRYEATVMAGTPSLTLAQEALRGCTIHRARGILNGTTNYILTQMHAGMPYNEALREAQEKGYAEADPTADVEGWDAAGKVLILAAALFNKPLRFDDLTVEGITGITAEAIREAEANGQRWKLIAEVTPDGGRVGPVRLPQSDPLAGISGATNAITLETDLLGDVTVIGPGAGRLETGFAILADLIAIHRQQSS